MREPANIDLIDRALIDRVLIDQVFIATCVLLSCSAMVSKVSDKVLKFRCNPTSLTIVGMNEV